MEWEKWMPFTARHRRGKRHLKDAPDNYRNLLGSWFLEYQSTRRNNQRTRAEANGRRVYSSDTWLPLCCRDRPTQRLNHPRGKSREHVEEDEGTRPKFSRAFV
ncbi:hypothetical protein ALC57_06701 [Trachymyrmex cornetzi]|uniref:Uncharacterized protein n=1 Tax=Trachymyrmex cornetzi TaxID=471704 RepID=A0A195E6G6_9HYME|nr:hypothetical protein ALC57_06701 [Trachymyrmex cornetzi]